MQQGLPMSKETVKAGNTMMIENILQIPVQPYEDGKSVYRVVEVQGRQSGQVRQTPLAVVQYIGKRYLIAPSRGRDWVHNLIVSGECTLVAQNEREAVPCRRLHWTMRQLRWFVHIWHSYRIGHCNNFPFQKMRLMKRCVQKVKISQCSASRN